MITDILETLIILGAKGGVFALIVYFVTKQAVKKAMEEIQSKENIDKSD